MMSGRRLQIGTVSVSASPWVGTEFMCLLFKGSPGDRGCGGLPAQLHLLPRGGLGVPAQRCKQGLIRVGEEKSLLI